MAAAGVVGCAVCACPVCDWLPPPWFEVVVFAAPPGLPWKAEGRWDVGGGGGWWEREMASCHIDRAAYTMGKRAGRAGGLQRQAFSRRTNQQRAAYVCARVCVCVCACVCTVCAYKCVHVWALFTCACVVGACVYLLHPS